MSEGDVIHESLLSGRICPKCAETLGVDATACGLCGFDLRRTAPGLRLLQLLSLTLALALIVVLCLGIKQLVDGI